jgi:hypothetical protein
MPLVSTIIVNFNAGNGLIDCVSSILASCSQSEIIVVDNASEDDSIDRLTAAFNNSSQVHILRNHANLGFSKACNIGAGKAVGRYLLFLNPDCVIDAATIPALIGALGSHSNAGMAGAMLLNPDGSEQAGARRTIPTPWRAFIRAFGLSRFQHRFPRFFSDFILLHEPIPETEIEVEAISGACMMVDKRVYKDVGSMDEGYFMHVEDLDWCMRMRNKGYKILFVPSAKVVHRQGTCSLDRPIFVEWHKHRGMLRYYRKFFRHHYSDGLMVAVAAGVWFHFMIRVAYLVLGKGLRRGA